MDKIEFCKKFSAALEKDFWGDISPDIFRNIAEGNTDIDDMHCDKESPGEMEDAVVAMNEILDSIF